jgi:Protein of unknown function DUF262
VSSDQLIASATEIGALLSSSRFQIPPFQREYSWTDSELEDFWSDLAAGWEDGEYFIGLVILTEGDDEGGDRRLVVDGQQRLLTITLLANQLYKIAEELDRKAVAQSIRSTFLFALDYETDMTSRRITLTDDIDDAVLEELLAGESPNAHAADAESSERIADLLLVASAYMGKQVRSHILGDEARRLGRWVKFLESGLRVAVFTHPDAESAYRVFEAINTRGRELTTADLLKSFVINHAPGGDRATAFARWKAIARSIGRGRESTMVQFIRHVVTVESGHVPPRDLYAYLTGKLELGPSDARRERPTVGRLLDLLEKHLGLYLQMIDPDADGPAEPEWREVFSALEHLGVIAVRPLLLAIAEHTSDQPADGMREVLRLVVRRSVVGNLGTGNVERRLSEAARQVRIDGDWRPAMRGLDDLNPTVEDFKKAAATRSLGKPTLAFLRRSQLSATMTPESLGFLHLVRPRQTTSWSEFPADEFSYWGATIGNTWLASVERRPRASSEWASFNELLAPEAVAGESIDPVANTVPDRWGPSEVEQRGTVLSSRLANIWYETGPELL